MLVTNEEAEYDIKSRITTITALSDKKLVLLDVSGRCRQERMVEKM